MLGELGESLAVRFLSRHGLDVFATNVAVGRGEVDVVANDGLRRVVVEVRTTTGRGDPIDAVGLSKRRKVEGLGWLLGADRVDFLGVGVSKNGVDVHWVPGSV